MNEYSACSSNSINLNLNFIKNDEEIQIAEKSNRNIDSKLINAILTVNRAYQEALNEKIAKLKKLLNLNIHQQVNFHINIKIKYNINQFNL